MTFLGRIKSVLFSRAQRGWVVEVFYHVTTSRQFTDEYHTIQGNGRSIVVAFKNAMVATWLHYREHTGVFK